MKNAFLLPLPSSCQPPWLLASLLLPFYCDCSCLSCYLPPATLLSLFLPPSSSFFPFSFLPSPLFLLPHLHCCCCAGFSIIWNLCAGQRADFEDLENSDRQGCSLCTPWKTCVEPIAEPHRWLAIWKVRLWQFFKITQLHSSGPCAL